jgi:hypothetical protein
MMILLNNSYLDWKNKKLRMSRKNLRQRGNLIHLNLRMMMIIFKITKKAIDLLWKSFRLKNKKRKE